MRVVETPLARADRSRAAARLVVAALFAALAWLTPSPAGAQSDKEKDTGAAKPAGGGTLTLEGAAGAPRQGAPQAPARAGGRPTATAVRFATPPAIDGKLDDAMWRTAAHLTKLVQQAPVEGSPASQQTDVYIGYDSERLYFGIYAHYTDRGLMRANRVDRDKTDNDDIVTVSFDPFLDQQVGYSFSVNGYGVQGDSVLRGNTGGGGGVIITTGATGDTTWDALFVTAGQLVDDGWTAEMAIPLKSLRYPPRGGGQVHRWGFQIERQIRSTNETDVWSPTSRSVVGYLRQMGVLDGMTNLSTTHNMEALPTFTAVRQRNLNKTTGATIPTNTNDLGLNLKYGITPTLTFDFTYNPDFSQIESDKQQIEVNQRFPIQYPELRPFFLEGIDNYLVQGPTTIINTRTIVDPQWGAKLTGKVGKATLGFLMASDQAPGKVDDPKDPAFQQSAQVGIARARYDFAPQAWVGAIYTDREFLNGYSRLTGIDAPLRLWHNSLLFRPIVELSDRVDPVTGRRQKGYEYNPFFVKEGRHLGWTAYHFEISPDFATDLGFIKQTDQKSTGGTLLYNFYPEGKIVSWSPQYSGSRVYDFKGVKQYVTQTSTLNIQFARNINTSAVVTHNMERFGGVDFVKNRFAFTGTVNTNRKILFTAKIDTGQEIRYVTPNPYLGHNMIYSLAMTVRPVARFQSVINIDTTNFTDVRTNTQAFDIKIFRFLSTYQFTPRLLLRNIMARNTFNKTLDANVLLTYRVNSGTALYVGYDDHYAQGAAVNSKLFPATEFERTNRAIFTKVQYLFRRS